MRKDGRGFSVIELLIVVAIILIIAAIAIQAFCGQHEFGGIILGVAEIRKIFLSYKKS